MASVLTSDQVNYLIWRYLQECGYTYSIYAFQHETKAGTLHDQYGPRIKPGSLISLIQRGLLYRELELQISKDGTKKGSADDLIPFFPPLSKDSKLVATTGTGNGPMEADDDEDDDEDEQMSSNTTIQQQAPSVTNSRKHGRGEEGINGVSSGGEKIGVPDKKKRRKTGATPAATAAPDRPDGAEEDKSRVDNLAGQSPSIEEVRPTTNGCSIGVQVETVTEIAASETLILTNEEQKVNVIAWSPVESGILVSGARSSMARIWSIPEGSDTPSHIVLDHSSDLTMNQEVTAVQWSNDGSVLATATFDGSIKLWNSKGKSMAFLQPKACAVLKLRWNRTSSILLSVHLDGTVLAWDLETSSPLYTIEGKGSDVDVAWVDDENFAVATHNGEIDVYAPKLKEAKAKFKGEEGIGIPSLAWDESAQRLAAGDAKGRIVIWGKSKAGPEFLVQAHKSQVSQLSWQPIRSIQSADSMNSEPTTHRILASRSDKDTVIRLWTFDSSTSKPPAPILELSSHASSVNYMSFSPDGKYLASGSYRKLYVWRVEDGFLSYVYDASTMKQEHTPLTNGTRNGIIEAQTNGDVEMGGMDDNEVDTELDIDSGKSSPDSYDISDISWEIKGTVVAVAMAGLGCVLVPIKPKPPTPRNHFSPPALASTSENGSNAEMNTSPATAETAITSPSAVNGTTIEEQVNGSLEKQNVR